MPRKLRQHPVLPLRDLNYFFHNIWLYPNFSIVHADFKHIINQLTIPANRQILVCDFRAPAILQYMLSAAKTFQDSSATAFFSLLHNDVSAYAASQYNHRDNIVVEPQRPVKVREALVDILARRAREKAEAEEKLAEQVRLEQEAKEKAEAEARAAAEKARLEHEAKEKAEAEARAAVEKARLEQEAKEKAEAEARAAVEKARLEQKAREIEKLIKAQENLIRREAGESRSIVHGEASARIALEARKNKIPQPIRAAQHAWEEQLKCEKKAKIKADKAIAVAEVRTVVEVREITLIASPEAVTSPAELVKSKIKKTAKIKANKSAVKPAVKTEVKKALSYQELFIELSFLLKEVTANRDAVIAYAQTIKPELELEDDGFATCFLAKKDTTKGQNKKTAKQQARLSVPADLLTQQLARFHQILLLVESHYGVMAEQSDDKQLRAVEIIRDARQEFLDLLLKEQVIEVLKNKVYQPVMKAISVSLGELITKSFDTRAMWHFHELGINLFNVYVYLKIKLSSAEGLPNVKAGIRHLTENYSFNCIMSDKFSDDSKAELLSNIMELFSDIEVARTDKLYSWINVRVKLLNIASISNVSISLKLVSALFKFYKMGFIPNMQGNLRQLNFVYTTLVEQNEEIPARFVGNIIKIGELITCCLGHMVWLLKNSVWQEFEFDLVLNYFVLAQKLLAKNDLFEFPGKFVDHLGYILIFNIQACHAIKKFFADREVTHHHQFNVFTRVIEGLLRQDTKYDSNLSNANKASNIYARLSLMILYVDNIFRSSLTTPEQKQHTAILFKKFVLEILHTRMFCLDNLLAEALEDVKAGKTEDNSHACKDISVLFKCVNTELPSGSIEQIDSGLKEHLPESKKIAVTVIKQILLDFRAKVEYCFDSVKEQNSSLSSKFVGDGKLEMRLRHQDLSGTGSAVVVTEDKLGHIRPVLD